MEKVRLAIGNEESAIIQIQKIQSSYPFKSLAEIVENGIDAGAKRIEIIRCRRKKGIELLVIDNGRGIAPGIDGNCDMRRVARSICDSIKIKRATSRKNVVGEFGIGLLGFPAIGGNIELTSRTDNSKRTAILRMKAYSIDAETDFTGTKQDTGTRVRLYPILTTAKHRLTAERMDKYLGKELSERIRETGVFIRITDKISGKTIQVKPQDYKGERIPIKDLRLPDKGNLKVRIYIAQQGDSSGKIALFKETKVLDDITTIDELDHFPWNSPLLEGMIKDRWIFISPSRMSIIPDENLEELVTLLKTLEPLITEKIREIEENRGQKLNREVYTALKSTISETMSYLPSSDYVWFNQSGTKVKVPDEMLVKDKDSERGGKKKFVKTAEGPLSYIQITPSFYDAVFNEMVTFKVTAWTKQGERILNSELKYEWKVSPAFLGSTEISSNELNFTVGNEEGMVEIRVKATLTYGGKKETAKKRAMVNVLKSMSRKKNRSSNAGFLKPIRIDKPGEDWRSRQTELGIEYNIGHRDYKNAVKSKKKGILRYLQKIYAKHIVLHSFSGEGEEAITERMVEIMSAIEVVNNGKV